jgi:hypothetical protein
VVDPDDPADEVLKTLSTHCLMVWIEGPDSHTEELIRRFDRDPKPMYYKPDFLLPLWQAWLAEQGITAEAADPNAFIRHAYRRAMAHRAPIYAAMARNWGVTVTAAEVEAVRDARDAEALVAASLGRAAPRA